MITFIHEFDETHIWVLGGNQAKDGAAVRDGVTVNIVKYTRAQVQEYRMPNSQYENYRNHYYFHPSTILFS